MSLKNALSKKLQSTGMVQQRWQTSVSASPPKLEMLKVARLGTMEESAWVNIMFEVFP